jgi:hypothetical protein
MRPALLLTAALVLALPSLGHSQSRPQPAPQAPAARPQPSPVATPRAWQMVFNREGGYQVELPGRPKDRRIDQKAANNQTVASYLQEVSLDNGDTYFGMVWTQITPPKDAAEAEKMMIRVRDTTAAALKGTLITTRPARLGEYQGLEYVIEAGVTATRFRYRVYIVGNRLVQQVYSGVTGSENSPDVRRFHQSLKLDPPKTG